MNKAIQKNNQLVRRDGLDLYFREVSRVPLLSREEERRLADQWFEHRDRQAGQTLVLSNLRFVAKVARGYTKYGFKLSDLIQEGNLGLLHAVDRFDPRKGYRLITYAIWWIRAYIQSFILRSWSIVRTGTTRVQRRIFSGLRKAREKIQSLGMNEEPNAMQLADALDISQDDFNEGINRINQRDVSIDQPVAMDSQATMADTLVDESPDQEARLIDNNLRKVVRERLDDAYDGLSPRERYLLEKRLLSDSPLTLEAVGAEFGITRERVRQLETRLKGKLRTVLAPALAATSLV